MNDMILNALEISLIVTAIYMTMQDGMIFEKLRIGLQILLAKTGHEEWIGKPMYGCLTCMGFWWGLLVYIFLYGINTYTLPTVLIVMGINTIIDKIIHYESN